MTAFRLTFLLDTDLPQHIFGKLKSYQVEYNDQFQPFRYAQPHYLGTLIYLLI
uniref:Uncharacterized protein n=1 Tax=Methylophaga nitratireducenticrescens TaxID=754476 RepID=I1XFV9_METNJ